MDPSDREGRAPCAYSAYSPEMAHRVTNVSAHVAHDIFHIVSKRLDIVKWISDRLHAAMCVYTTV